MTSTEKKDLISQIDALRKEGKTLKEATEQLGTYPAFYYAAKSAKGKAKKTKNKSKAVKTTKSVSVDKQAFLAALYQHVDYNTFHCVVENWR